MSYSQELIEVLALDPPSVKSKDDGFLDLPGIQYKEVAISKVYAYFLDKEKNHAVAALFLNALLDLIKEKTKRSFTFSNPVCSLEVLTKKGNRIDLLIESNEGKTEKEAEAIIIENKIYSGLYNDLEDYWGSVKAGNKIGVLLTLYPYESKLNGNFINITHAEWMQQIKAAGLPSGLTLNQYVYLNDFINNMENLAKTSALNEEARFFFKHPAKVLKAKQTYDAASNYVIEQLRIVAEKLGWSLSGNSWVYRHISDAGKQPQVYYAVVFDKVTSANPEITLYLEIYKEALKQEEELRKILSEEHFYENLKDDHLSPGHWAHLAYKTYNLNFDAGDIENLSGFVLKKIEQDFQPAYNLIFSKLKTA